MLATTATLTRASKALPEFNREEITTMTTWMITIRRLLFSFVGSGIVCLGLAGAGQAGIPQAFVSTTGNDTNLCTSDLPCRTFNKALVFLDPGGEIVVQKPGVYSGGFTIKKSVTIDASGVDASVVSAGPADACTIAAAPTDRVVLKGIRFRGPNAAPFISPSNAITITQPANVYVDHCSISEFHYGVLMLQGGSLWVSGTDVRASDDGIWCYDADAPGTTPGYLVARDSIFTELAETAIGVNSDTGGAHALVSNCTASRCGLDGFRAGSSGSAVADLTLVNCRAFNNQYGVKAVVGAGLTVVRLANCVVAGNTTGVEWLALQGGAADVLGTSPGSNVISGNANGNSTSGSVISQ